MQLRRGQTAVEYTMIVAAGIVFAGLIAYIVKSKAIG